MSFFLMVSKDLSDCHWIQLRGQEWLNATPEESKRCKRAQPFRGGKTRALEFNYRSFSDMTSIFLAHQQSSWNSSSRYWISQHSSKESIARKSSKILVSCEWEILQWIIKQITLHILSLHLSNSCVSKPAFIGENRFRTRCLQTRGLTYSPTWELQNCLRMANTGKHWALSSEHRS